MIALVRYACILVLGVIITLSLFYLMHRLIEGPAVEPASLEAPPGIHFGHIDLDDPVPLPPRTRPPEPPEPPEDLPPPPETDVQTRTVDDIARELPDLDMPRVAGDGFRIQTAGAARGQRDQGAERLVAIQPTYPRQAAIEGVEGWVEVELLISAQGTVQQATILRSEPARVFDQAALQALKRWRFRPASKDGEPVEQRIVQRLDFDLQD